MINKRLHQSDQGRHAPKGNAKERRYNRTYKKNKNLDSWTEAPIKI